MTKFSALLLLFFMTALTTMAAGDIHINNVYYTEEALVREEVVLQGAEYSNVVVPSPTGVYISGRGNSQKNESAIREDIGVNSREGYMGATMGLEGVKPGWSKSVVAGPDNSVALSYDLDSGVADTRGFNDYTQAGGSILLQNNTYSGSIRATPRSIAIEGEGKRVSQEDQESGVAQNLWLIHMGRWCNIEYGLDTEKAINFTRDDSFQLPTAIYTWNTSVSSMGADWAMASVNLNMVAGTHVVTAHMDGYSSVLKPKHLQPVEINPLDLDRAPEMKDLVEWIEGLNVTRTQYMTYTLGDNI